MLSCLLALLPFLLVELSEGISESPDEMLNLARPNKRLRTMRSAPWLRFREHNYSLPSENRIFHL